MSAISCFFTFWILGRNEAKKYSDFEGGRWTGGVLDFCRTRLGHLCHPCRIAPRGCDRLTGGRFRMRMRRIFGGGICDGRGREKGAFWNLTFSSPLWDEWFIAIRSQIGWETFGANVCVWAADWVARILGGEILGRGRKRSKNAVVLTGCRCGNGFWSWWWLGVNIVFLEVKGEMIGE